MNIRALLDDLSQDIRYATRTLRRDAGLTLFAIAIVGLGIGASVTVFSISDALLLRPLPFRDAGRLLWIGNGGTSGTEHWNTEVNHFKDLAAENRSFGELGGYFGGFTVGGSNLTSPGDAERLSSISVTQTFFHTLGVQPIVGHDFTAEESTGTGPSVALMSHGLWVRRFSSDPGVVGSVLTINGVPVTVVGVLPASFDFGTVFAPGNHVDLFRPFPLTDATDHMGNSLVIVGRLKDGVTPAAATAEVKALGKQLTADHASDRNAFNPNVASLQQHVSGGLRTALTLLGFGVAVVMLIVCANLSNMLLARATTRQQEIAVRAALGASRSRQVRQMLTESVVLASGGALLGVALAIAGTRAVAGMSALTLPLLQTVRLDGTSLAFALTLALGAGLLFGLAPALQIPAAAIGDALRASGRGATGDKTRQWMRNGLVVSEIALACVLLVGAGLLSRSFLKVLDTDLGFRPERVAALRVDKPGPRGSQDEQNAYFDDVLARVRQIPGVADAGLTDAVPLDIDRSYGVFAKGADPTRDIKDAFIRTVTDGYVHTMGIRLIEGRDITTADTPLTEPIVLVNETAARTLWPGESAVGKILDRPGGRRVVGVVADVRHSALEKASGLEVYIPLRQTGDYASANLVVRSSIAPAAVAASVRSALAPIAPGLATNGIRTLQQLVDSAVSPRRFFALMLGGFAFFAIFLALLGIYSVISYTVTQRTREIAVRMALGASVTQLQARIITQTLQLAVAGMIIGSAASWALARTLGGMLYGVTSTDPFTYVAMLATLTLAATLGGYLPARRASRIDPMLAIRAN
jgi:predicted permease